VEACEEEGGHGVRVGVDEELLGRGESGGPNGGAGDEGRERENLAFVASTISEKDGILRPEREFSMSVGEGPGRGGSIGAGGRQSAIIVALSLRRLEKY